MAIIIGHEFQASGVHLVEVAIQLLINFIHNEFYFYESGKSQGIDKLNVIEQINLWLNFHVESKTI